MYLTFAILIVFIFIIKSLVGLHNKKKPKIKSYRQNIKVFVCPNCATKLPVEKHSGYKNLQTLNYEYSLQCLKCQLNFLANINFKAKNF
jgi:transcription elongation factor Elf1